MTEHVPFYAGKEPFCVRVVIEMIPCLMFMYKANQRTVHCHFKQMKIMSVKWMCCLYRCLYWPVKKVFNCDIFLN